MKVHESADSRAYRNLEILLLASSCILVKLLHQQDVILLIVELFCVYSCQQQAVISQGQLSVVEGLPDITCMMQDAPGINDVDFSQASQGPRIQNRQRKEPPLPSSVSRNEELSELPGRLQRRRLEICGEDGLGSQQSESQGAESGTAAQVQDLQFLEAKPPAQRRSSRTELSSPAAERRPFSMNCFQFFPKENCSCVGRSARE